MIPKLDGVPSIDPKTGRLHVRGVFEDQPYAVVFALLYEPAGGKWRVFGLAVNALPAQGIAQAPAAQPAPAKPAKVASAKKAKKVQAPAPAVEPAP